MSVLTFEILSAELTQSLAEQNTTPPETTARCTLGRDKVMVLVEYPLDSAKAEPSASQTLDWLEQQLRHQFDTTGLPEEAVDLAGIGSEVSVQLFLKHLSESKPFTMRSFIWKVDDGFDELFGAPLAANQSNAARSSSVEAYRSQGRGSVPTRARTELARSSAPSSFGRQEARYETPVFYRADEDLPHLEKASSAESAAAKRVSKLSGPVPRPISGSIPGPLEDQTDFSDLTSFNSELDLIELPAPYFQDEELVPSELDDEHLQLDLESDLDIDGRFGLGDELDLYDESYGETSLDADLAMGMSVGMSGGMSVDELLAEPSGDFDLPGGSLELDSDEFNLPTLDVPGTRVPDIYSAEADFFNLDETATSQLKAAEPLDLDMDLDSAMMPSESGTSRYKPQDLDLEDLDLENPNFGSSTPYDLSSEFDEYESASVTADEALLTSDEDLSEVAPVFAEFTPIESEPIESESIESESIHFDLVELASTESEPIESELELSFIEPELIESELELESDLVELKLIESELIESIESEIIESGFVRSELNGSELVGSKINESELSEFIKPESFAMESFGSELDDGPELVAPELIEFDSLVSDSDRTDSDRTELLDTESFTAELVDAPELVRPEARSYTSEENEDEQPLAEAYAREEYEDEEYEDEEYEEEFVEDVYEDDPAYYLEGEEGEAVEDIPLEDVSWVDETEVQRQRDQWQQQSKPNPWVFAGALGFALVGVLGFVITRPCTFGQCDRLQTAQSDTSEALSNLRVDSSAEAVTTSKQQFKRSIDALKPIPVWSSYYGQAQGALPIYESQVQALDWVSEAQTTAYQAAVASQNPPHPASEWQVIADSWLKAAQLLERVPTDSPVRELVNAKLVEYRANRATILVRIDAESRAELSLRQAQQAASLGTKQMESAKDLDTWEKALASWSAAVDKLSQIPNGTYAHGEAQKLLPEYLKKLDEVRDRTEQELGASRILSDTKRLVAEAKKAETDEQWSVSLQKWKSAFSQLQTIPPKTLAHGEAQTIQGTYVTSLKKAENNLQVALRFAPIEPKFFTACSAAGTAKCAYSIKSGSVRLDLGAGYDTVINYSITPPAQRSGDSPAAALVAQANQLLQEITLLSTQVQVPLELYDAKGDFLALYRPDLNGFTRQVQQASAAQ